MMPFAGIASPRVGAWLAAAALCCAGAVPALAAGSILVGGSSSGCKLLEALAGEYRKTARGAEIIVVDPAIGSSAAIKAVWDGRLQIGIASRPLKSEERGGNLVDFEFVRTPLVFASRDHVQVGGFTLGQLVQIYSGVLTRWENGTPIRLILRSSFASDTRVIRAMSPDLDEAMTLALDRKGMVVAGSDVEALQIIERTPGSLGPTTLGLVRLMDSSVRVFRVAGRMPSARALADGSYPWFKTFYLVVPAQPAPDVRAFLNFLRSAQAADFLRRIEHLPASDGK